MAPLSIYKFFPEEIAIWFSSQPLISGEALASPVPLPLHTYIWTFDKIFFYLLLQILSMPIDVLLRLTKKIRHVLLLGDANRNLAQNGIHPKWMNEESYFLKCIGMYTYISSSTNTLFFKKKSFFVFFTDHIPQPDDVHIDHCIQVPVLIEHVKIRK